MEVKVRFSCRCDVDETLADIERLKAEAAFLR